MSLSVESGVCWFALCLVYCGFCLVGRWAVDVAAQSARLVAVGEMSDDDGACLPCPLDRLNALFTTRKLTHGPHFNTTQKTQALRKSPKRRRCPISQGKRTKQQQNQAPHHRHPSSISAAVPFPRPTSTPTPTTTHTTNTVISQVNGNPTPLPRGQGPVHPPVSFHCPGRHQVRIRPLPHLLLLWRVCMCMCVCGCLSPLCLPLSITSFGGH